MMMIEEQAKEELRILEAQYPNRYEYLKLELKSFIVDLLQSDIHDRYTPFSDHTHFSTDVATQESTSDRKRKKISENHCIDHGSDEQELQNNLLEDGVTKTKINANSGKLGKRRDRVEVVLERANACLRKIRHLKSSLLSCSAD